METKITSEKWNERYRKSQYAYGKSPNNFFKEQLIGVTNGNILMPADGEGRNGVFAAQKGWQVTSFDISQEGKIKALALAQEKDVSLSYKVGMLEELEFKIEAYDAIGLIYAHFSGSQKEKYHKQLDQYLKVGGIIILEAFSQKHIAYNKKNPAVGGPKKIEELYTVEEIKKDFDNYNIKQLTEEEVELKEGAYHIGKGSVIRFVGEKLKSKKGL